VISPVVVGRKEQQLRLGEPKRSLVLDNTHGHPVGSLEFQKRGCWIERLKAQLRKDIKRWYIHYPKEAALA
tara:strand:- start:810 stop:1022 length:213 start_codon:yes stop_codon:yes gene_type:complete